MFDTVIVGGGLCGLVLARALQQQGHHFALYEARDRLGGRILSRACPTAGMPVDLGATWFWPGSQSRIVRLIAELGLEDFPQHDDGTVLQLTDHDQRAQTAVAPGLHGGARRLADGMATLIDALAASLPATAVHLKQELVAVRERGMQVELLLRCGDVTTIVRARQVVLAIPPRLLEERVSFDPPLSDELREAMRATHTWMADQAKVVVGYTTPSWRANGNSGNAFVSHEQVALGEIFDACDAGARHAALGGFFALPPDFRATIHASAMPMLVSSQMVQVFGPQAEEGEQHLQDWSAERYTCAPLDRTPPDSRPAYGAAALRCPLWDGKLLLGTSETATYGGGYMEGALEAAARIQRALAAPAAADTDSNGACLARFGEAVAALRAGALERYRQHLNRHLATQEKTQLTQRALLDTVEQIYSEALDQLGALPFDTAAVAVERGRSDLTPGVLAPFAGFNAALLDEVIVFNRGSCAISNFPEEHAPPADYVDAITRDLAAAWREFALNANDMLLGNGGADERLARAG